MADVTEYVRKAVLPAFRLKLGRDPANWRELRNFHHRTRRELEQGELLEGFNDRQWQNLFRKLWPRK